MPQNFNVLCKSIASKSIQSDMNNILKNINTFLAGTFLVSLSNSMIRQVIKLEICSNA